MGEAQGTFNGRIHGFLGQKGLVAAQSRASQIGNRKSRRRASSIAEASFQVENMERRTMLSVVDVTGGALSYTASTGVTNNIVLTTTVVSGTNYYAIADTGEAITLSGNASSAGWVLVNPNLAAGPQAGITSINIDSQDGNDSVIVQNTNAPTTISPTNGGNDTVVIGDTSSNTLGLGTLQGINGSVTISNSTGSTLLDVNGSLDSVGEFIGLSSSTLSGIAPNNINYGSANISTLVVSGSSGGNVYSVSSTPTGTTVLAAGTGSDDVFVLGTSSGTTLAIDGSGGTDLDSITNGGSTQGILGNILVANTGGKTLLNIDDSADTTSRTLAISDSALVGMQAGSISYTASELSGLDVSAGSAGNTIVVTGTPASTTILTGDGSNIVAVQGTDAGQPLSIDGQAGTNTIVIGNASSTTGIQGSVTLSTSTSGTILLQVDNSADVTPEVITVSTTTITGIAPVTIDYSGATLSGLAVLAGSGGNVIDIVGTTAPTTVDSGTGIDIVVVAGTSAAGPLTIDGQAGADIVDITNSGSVQGILGAVSVLNSGGKTTLDVDDSADTTPRIVTLAVNQLTGLAPATISFNPTQLSGLNILGGSGGNNFTVTGTPLGSTSIDAGSGNDGVTVQGTTATSTLAIDGAGGNDIVDISNAGSVQGILGAISVANTSGSSALFVDDSADANPTTAIISDASITGLAPAVISYTAGQLSSLTVLGGSGGNTFEVSGTPAATTLDSGTGNDTIFIVGTDASAPLILNGQAGGDVVTISNAGSVQGILAPVTILNASGATELTVDDSADTTGRVATLSDTSLTGLAPGSITYGAANLVALFVKGGSGGNTFTITGTPSATGLSAGTGNDTVNVQGTDIGNALTIDGQSGNDTVAIGNAGNAQGILAPVTIVNAAGTTALSVDDSADSTPRSVGLTSSTLSGITPGLITFGSADLISLIVKGGTGGNIFLVTSTPTGTTGLLTGTGNDTVAVQGTTAGTVLDIDGVAGTDLVDITNAGSVQGILGPVNVGNTSGATALIVDDSADTTARGVTLSDSSLTGLAPATIGYTKGQLSSLSVLGGSAGNIFVVTGTPAQTNLDTGIGNDNVNVQGTDAGDPLNVLGQAGTDVVLVGNNGSVQGIFGNVLITNATGTTHLHIDDSADPTGQTATLAGGPTNATLTGLAPATISYTTANIADLTIVGGLGSDTFTIDFTNGNPVPAGSINYNGGGGTNNLNLVGGSFTNEVYNPSGPGAGTIVLDGTPTVITFSNINNIDDTIPVVNFTFTSPIADGPSSIVNGPIVGGLNTMTIESNDSGPPDYVAISVANKVNVTVNDNTQTGAGDATDTLNDSIAAAGLTTLTLVTGAGNDLVYLNADPNGVATLIKTGSGADIINTTLAGLATTGSTKVDAGTGQNVMNVNAGGLAVNTATAGEIIAGSIVLNYANFMTINLTNVKDQSISSTTRTLNLVENTAAVNAVVAAFTDSDPNGKATDFTATINWGDGTTTNGGVIVANGGGFDVVGTHTYTSTNKGKPYTITVTILDKGSTGSFSVGNTQFTVSDNGGATTTACSTAKVAAAPILAQGTTNTGKNQTNTSYLVSTFVDQGSAKPLSAYTVTIDWGDGSSSTKGTVTLKGANYSVNGTHNYCLPGNTKSKTYTVKITITNGETTTTVTSQITIAAAAAPPYKK